MRKFHNEVDHFGINKTWIRVRKYMYWKPLRKDIQIYVNNCSGCAETKPDLRKIKKNEYHITSKYPLQLISVHIIERIPKAKTFEYILSIVGVHSKFVM